MDLMWMFELL